MSFLSAFVAFVLPMLPPTWPALGPAVVASPAARAEAPMRYRGIEALFAAFEAGARVR